MANKTIKQIERQLRKELTGLDIGFDHWYEALHTECNGKIVLGRHVCVLLGAKRVSREQQAKVVRAFRKYWHRNCQRHAFEGVQYNNSEAIHSCMTITF